MERRPCKIYRDPSRTPLLPGRLNETTSLYPYQGASHDRFYTDTNWLVVLYNVVLTRTGDKYTDEHKWLRMMIFFEPHYFPEALMNRVL